jgi:hypothetical protein
MSITHNFECAIHGQFEARVQGGITPPCPAGCDTFFVKLVFTQPPSIATERVRNATRLIKEAIDAAGLSDVDISPHTPGDSPADKNWKKAHHDIKAEVWDKGKLGEILGQFPKGENYIKGMGLGSSRPAFTKVKG